MAGTKRSERTGISLDRMVDIIRTRIVNHDLPPGLKLREHTLAEEFCVSRQRIRETFGVLEERGLIERIPNRGAVVTRLGVEQVNELFEIREALEAYAVRLATEKAPAASWDDLIAMFDGPAEQAVQRNDLDTYVECISAFRRRAVDAANNPLLTAQLDRLYDRTRVLIRRLVLVPGRARQGLRQHQEILRAMRAGDTDLAERLKRENIRSSKAWFQDYKKYLL